MHERLYTIHHNEKEILYTDWTNMLDPEEFCRLIWETSRIVSQKRRFNLLEIVDVSGSYFNLNVFKNLKEAALETKPYNKRKCVVGNFSDKRLYMLKVLNRFSDEEIIAFADLQAAKEWISTA